MYMQIVASGEMIVKAPSPRATDCPPLDQVLVAQMYLVGLSHCVVRVMWFRYCILPEAVLLSSQLFQKTTFGNTVSQLIINNIANYLIM